MRHREAEQDREVAALLSAQAFIEIRYLAYGARHLPEDQSPDKTLERIRFLADLCHNLPGITRPRRWSPSRRGATASTREQALTQRPMSWTWNTAGPQARAWMLGHITAHHPRWTPPPPIPQRPSTPPALTLRQEASALLGRWPVQAPPGEQPLPEAARALKAVDTATVCALYEEAGRLRLGLGKGGPWLHHHLHPDAVHHIVPDPADYYWPGRPEGSEGTIRWWQCTVLLRMYDGEQVSSMIAVMPETFTALPQNLPRRRQARLVHLARATERDTYLWGRDHKTTCGPQTCGYAPEPAEG
ncbi:hypothetical protein ACFQY4_23270 [Catellatospora bangladeshensis]|uniref:Uncharacterized protein n=1 Tax=Catellatospora bangladeshensis TaxID=310355 RepID=A0A8J3J9U1_9ACTN|nr:hypothetical protein [Catellatospora bangladeshensis]GIF80286.1 hypothetical protein Cba03nite_16350 [Catellatospora bangladeshensis]